MSSLNGDWKKIYFLYVQIVLGANLKGCENYMKMTENCLKLDENVIRLQETV